MNFLNVMSKFGNGIDLLDFSTSNTEPALADEQKGLFDGKEKEQIAKLEAELDECAAKAKKSEETVMYTLIGVVALMLMGIIKFK
jgi:hypothetical protein